MTTVAEVGCKKSKQYALQELELESRIGGMGKSLERQIPVIDLSNFDERRAEIEEQLWDAAVHVGFFQLINHGISHEDIDRAFENSARFFSLPTEIKQKYPLGRNVGWESLSQIRPSTGTIDQKESYQITLSRMDGYFPTEDELPGFRRETLDFERKNWSLAQKLLTLFLERMKMPEEVIKCAHDYNSPEYQSTLRFLHYYEQKEEDLDPRIWRAGAHTDWTTLTLLHQRNGQGGLEVCPGFDSDSPAWTPIKPENYVITCNIGDMLQRWSDDELKSTLHRVRSPLPGEDLSARNSVVFFFQANENMLLSGPKQLHRPITAGEFISERLRANSLVKRS